MKTLDRAMVVLQIFVGRQEAVSLAELVEYTGWSKATAYRFAHGLAQTGLLQRVDGGYALGELVPQLNSAYMLANPLRARIASTLQSAATELDATVQVCMLRETYVVVTHSHEGPSPLRAAAQLGEVVPLESSAAARAAVSALSGEESEQRISAVKSRGFAVPSDDAEVRLRGEIERCRDDGFSVSRDEFHEGLAGVAVPLGLSIFGQASALVALVPSSSLSESRLIELRRGLSNAASQIRGP